MTKYILAVLLAFAGLWLILEMGNFQKHAQAYGDDTGYRQAEYSSTTYGNGSYGGEGITKTADDYGGGAVVKTDYSNS